jgi:hypothetical protein
MNKEKALARLILSTKRTKRNFNLVQVYEDLVFLLSNGDTIKSLSTKLGVSPGMLNQFLSIEKICPELVQYVESREIDSVTLVFNLSKFNINDQIAIADYLSNDELTSHDVRALLPLRRQNPDIEIKDLIIRLLDSKKVKLSVIKFPKSALLIIPEAFKKRIKKIIGDENFDDLIEDNEMYSLKISQKGEKELRKVAKKNKKDLNSYFNSLLK